MGRRKHPIIAAVLHELLKRESFATYPDLKEALKCRCATLRIPYEQDKISEAPDLVERNRKLLTHGRQSQRYPRRTQGPADSRGGRVYLPQSRGQSGFVRLGGIRLDGCPLYPGESQ